MPEQPNSGSDPAFTHISYDDFRSNLIDAECEQGPGFVALVLEGDEMMAAVQIAMMGTLSSTALRDGTFAHPTLAESFNNLFAPFAR